MSEGISTMKTGQKCVCIEKNSDCFASAVERWSQVLPPASQKRPFGEMIGSDFDKDRRVHTKLVKGPTIKYFHTSSASVNI